MANNYEAGGNTGSNISLQNAINYVRTHENAKDDPAYMRAMQIIHQAAMQGNPQAQAAVRGSTGFGSTQAARRMAGSIASNPGTARNALSRMQPEATSNLPPSSLGQGPLHQSGGSTSFSTGSGPGSVSGNYTQGVSGSGNAGTSFSTGTGTGAVSGNYTQGTPTSQANTGAGISATTPSSPVPGQEVFTSGDLGGNFGGLNSAYLQNVDPSDPALRNSLLMNQGYASNSYMGSLLDPVGQSFHELNALANPGVLTSKQSQLQNVDTMYSGLAGGSGGAGMIDAQALYDNLFGNGGMGDNGYLQHNPNPADQYNMVKQLVTALAPVMPAESLNMLMSNVNNAYLQFSDAANRTGGPDPATFSFIDYLKSIGAQDWF